MPNAAPEISIFEWLMSFLLVAIGAQMMAFPDAVSVSHMRLITVDADDLGLACFLVGLFRLATLTNPKIFGSRVMHARIAGAACAAVIWASMVTAFGWRIHVQRAQVPPGFFMLSAQMIGEIWLIFRIARLRR